MVGITGIAYTFSQEVRMKHIDIAATLERGRYFSGAYFALVFVLFVLSLVAFIGIVIVMVLHVIGLIYENSPYALGVFIALLCFALIIFAFSCYYVMRILSHRKFIEQCLPDTIRLCAEVKEIGENHLRGLIIRAVSIKVTFVFNDEEHMKISGKIVNGKQKILYAQCFEKYCGKVIEILYSPTFDAVLFPG